MFKKQGLKGPCDWSQLFGSEFEQHNRSLRQYLWRKIKDPEVIKDVMQQTYTNVIAALRRGDDIKDFPAYLRRTGHNAYIDFVRQKNSRKRILDVDAEPLDEERYSHELSLNSPQGNLEVTQGLEECLQKLTEREQGILFFECWKEDVLQKIAEEYGLTEGTARKYRDRIVAKFLAIMNGK